MTALAELRIPPLKARPGAGPEKAIAEVIAKLLADGAPLLDRFERIAARLRLPRLPRSLAEPDQVAVLEHWLHTLDVDQPRPFGLDAGLAYKLSCWTAGGALWQEEIGAVSREELTPEFVHAVVQAALLYAPDASRVARTLTQLAEVMVQELQQRGLGAQPLRALRGELEAAKAGVEGLSGNLRSAVQLLTGADRRLGTCNRVVAWTDGHRRLVPPASPRVPLRSHGFWMHSRGLVEVAAGHLEEASRCFEIAFDLYLADRAFLGAGMAAVLKASTSLWRGLLVEAVNPLEVALQLLDLRSLFRLGDVLPLELVILYARLNQPEKARQEAELLAGMQPLSRSEYLRSLAWLERVEGDYFEAEAKLLQALREAPDAGTRRLVKLELASWDVERGFGEAALERVRAETSQLDDLSAPLRKLWLAAVSNADLIPGLIAATMRSQALPQVAWAPPRTGTVLDPESVNAS